MRRALQLIINVDDIGLHPAVRRAVEACAERGTVTSATPLYVGGAALIASRDALLAADGADPGEVHAAVDLP